MKIIHNTATNRPQATHGSDLGPRELSEHEIKFCEENKLNHSNISHIRYEGDLIIIYWYP
jgi:hypothetical protein